MKQDIAKEWTAARTQQERNNLGYYLDKNAKEIIEEAKRRGDTLPGFKLFFAEKCIDCIQEGNPDNLMLVCMLFEKTLKLWKEEGLPE